MQVSVGGTLYDEHNMMKAKIFKTSVAFFFILFYSYSMHMLAYLLTKISQQTEKLPPYATGKKK